MGSYLQQQQLQQQQQQPFTATQIPQMGMGMGVPARQQQGFVVQQTMQIQPRPGQQAGIKGQQPHCQGQQQPQQLDASAIMELFQQPPLR